MERSATMKWHYVPFVGLIVTLIIHKKVVNNYLKFPKVASIDDTWEAASNCMTAIICTFSSGVIAILAFALLSS